MGLARTLQQGNPVLGWLLRLMIVAGRIPLLKLIAIAVVFGVILPRFLKGSDQPEFLRIAGHVIGTSAMVFFYLSLVAGPLFDVVLAMSKNGRYALGGYEMRAVRWCLPALLLGLIYLALWIVNGAKSVPFSGIGWLSAAALLHEAVSNRHPWVRRRLLAIAGAACAASLWFSIGPMIVLRPLAYQVVEQLKSARGAEDSKVALRGVESKFKDMMRVQKHYFVYPALLIYLIAAYSDEIAQFLKRRAPDEPE